MPKCPFCDESVAANAAACPGCGAPLSPTATSEDLEREVRGLLDRQQKIEAIKVYREATGAGLAEAKAAVEAFQAGVPLPATRRSSPATAAGPAGSDWEAEALQLLAAGKKIQAIKLYRELHGGGLKDAKQAIDALAAQHGIAAGTSGCLGIVLLLAALVVTYAS